LEDTARSVQLLYGAGDWQSLRRATDYYDESLLIWLEADQIIRSKTSGRKSLDDFCSAFFGQPGGPPSVKPYAFDDVVKALNAIAPYDWADFFEHRVYDTKTPLGGLTASGWNLSYGDVPGPVLAARSNDHDSIEERFSIGLLLRSDGGIIDVVRNSPAWRAGLGPGMRIMAINGRTWSPQILHDAIAADRTVPGALEMLVQSQSSTFKATVEDQKGLQYPRLERNSSPDTLSEILKPRVAAK
jgi:predicted metalloprotease with PDZ domain